MEEIKITLETLYDILRNEKKREELQKLENTFYQDVANYVKDKISFLEQRRIDKDIFASGERDKLEYELRSIRKIMKEIYEKREKKIFEIALNKSRTGSDIIDTGSMLPEEKEFYLKNLRHLDEFRKGILFSLFKGEMPTLLSELKQQFQLVTEDKSGQKIEPKLEHKPETRAEISAAEERTQVTLIAAEEKPKEAPVVEETPKETPIPAQPELPKSKIKFLHPVPSFVWKDMKVYGPFSPGEETEIFAEVAELLVRKGRAEKAVITV